MLHNRCRPGALGPGDQMTANICDRLIFGASVYSATLLLGCHTPTTTESVTEGTINSTATATMAATTAGAESDTAATSGDPCEVNHVPETTALEVIIRNAGNEPMYVVTAAPDISLGPGYFVERSYDLIDAVSSDIVNTRGICFWYQRCTVSYWCPYTFDTKDHDPCDAKPVMPSPIVIYPGGVYRPLGWDGLTYTHAVLPYECQNPLCGGPVDLPTMCLQALSYSGNLVARILVANDIECNEPGLCDCEPNADGWCRADMGVALSPTALESGLSFPGTQSVEIVIP